MKTRPLLLILGLLGTSFGCTTAPAVAQTTVAANEFPEELGIVKWGRDFDAAKAESKRSGKPLFVLFDEVPGCSTVKGFGKNVLSNPLVADAIEEAFVPVVVYNNVSGKDRTLLESFGEPTWNNPVVRIITPDRKPLANRFAGPYSIEGLVSNMRVALKAAKQKVPTYLDGIASSTDRTAYFSMYCFWTGEVKFAGIKGVVGTRAGFMSGHEVVEVTYDASNISYAELAKAAKSSGAASGALPKSKAEKQAAKVAFSEIDSPGKFRFSAKDDKYQIRNSKWKKAKLTNAQATKINRAHVSRGSDASVYLSPRQRAAIGK